MNQAQEIMNEGLLSRVADTAYAIRFLKLLVTPWDKMSAFEYGLIDKNGKKIKKAELPNEKAAYTIFHRLVFNIKRILNAAPGGVGKKIASYATALFLLKEHTQLSEEEILEVLDQLDDTNWNELPINESKWFQNTYGVLNPGSYKLTKDIASPITGEYLGFKDSVVMVEDFTEPYDIFLNCYVYKVTHRLTNQELFVTNHDIRR
tara:strand:- start:617 stop:1231 length:615 start_codon:yes stop_codon:yes gene_type:complete